MIPIEIKLKDFGAIPELNIDLRDIHIAAITGQNGAGKSTTFTGAPLWGLFGESRSNGADDVIRAGESDCSVVFSFEHRGKVYRVIRTRSNAGRGKSTLELQRCKREFAPLMWGDGPEEVETWETLSGTTIRETQEKINELLNLDADTFTSTAMIMQGRSNEFTAKAPGQRKAILTQILGLDIYDLLLERTRKHAADTEKSISNLNAKLDTMQEALQERTGVDDEILHVMSEIQKEEADLAEIEAGIKKLETERAEAEQYRKEGEEKERQTKELIEKERDLAAQIGIGKEKIAALDAQLAREGELSEQAERHGRAKQSLDALDGLLQRRDQLMAEHLALIARIDTARAELGPIQRNLQGLREQIARKAEVSAGAKDYEVALRQVQEDQEQARKAIALEKELADLIVQRESQAAEIKPVNMEIRNCEAKIERLKESGCVDLPAAEKSPCAFLKDAILAKESLPALMEKSNALEFELDRIVDAIHAKKDEIAAFGYSPEAAVWRAEEAERLRHNVGELERILRTEEMLPPLERQYASMAERLKADEERKKELAVEIDELAGSLSDTDYLRRQIAETAEAVRLLQEIPVLRERRGSLEEKLNELNALYVDVCERKKALMGDIIALGNFDPYKKAEEYAHEIEGAKYKYSSLSELIKRHHGNLGALQQRQVEAKNLAEEISRLEQDKTPLAKELVKWRKLERAFGRDGIPAFIIENAIPELERLANDILSQMSGGEHSLRFETQRELKSRDAKSETLDIFVADWQGERPYETFSGGEQLRIDLAIRFGLAELLANRAGSKVEWIVLDEGIGSQDAEHRAMVLDAIKHVSDRFKKVLVITHIEEAQGAFPQQIHLERTDDRVEARVS